MALSDFIRDHHREIIDDFEAFARSLVAPGDHMSSIELRDHAEELLTALVVDITTTQNAGEQSRKSKGLGRDKAMAASGVLHADARIQHGFTPAQLLAEFRALRASVLRLYESSGEADLAGVRRFNEAIDEALTESLSRYAAQTDTYRDQFVGVLGHDLRNPLSAIMAGGALLTTAAAADQRQARVAAGILRSAQRMGRMIDDLLDLTVARLGGAMPLKRAATDLQQICQEALLEAQTARPTQVLRFESGGDLTGDWDSDRLAQVLSNLLGNAIQHGDGQPVGLSAQGGPAEVVVAVHNHGVPIPPGARHAIFEPLVRHASGVAKEGSSIGLGLFIARAIVKSHGGAIDFASSADEGTTFTVRLPRRAPVAPAAEQ